MRDYFSRCFTQAIIRSLKVSLLEESCCFRLVLDYTIIDMFSNSGFARKTPSQVLLLKAGAAVMYIQPCYDCKSIEYSIVFSNVNDKIWVIYYAYCLPNDYLYS